MFLWHCCKKNLLEPLFFKSASTNVMRKTVLFKKKFNIHTLHLHVMHFWPKYYCNVSSNHSVLAQQCLCLSSKLTVTLWTHVSLFPPPQPVTYSICSLTWSVSVCILVMYLHMLYMGNCSEIQLTKTSKCPGSNTQSEIHEYSRIFHIDNSA